MFHHINNIGKSTEWTPAFINTTGWYDPSDASTITDTGGLVDQLDDKGGTEHLVGAGSSRPTTGTRTLNGLNVLDCDGGDFLSKSSFTLPTSGNLSINMIAEVNGIDNVADSIVSMDASNDWQFNANNSSQFNGRIATSMAGSLNLTGGAFTGARIFGVTFDYDIGEIEAFVDGISRGVNTGYTGSKLSTSMILRIFNNRAGTQLPFGAFGEVVITGDVTTATRINIENYLSNKWGV